MKKKILLVGRDPMEMRESIDFLVCMGDDWDAVPAPTTDEALEFLKQDPYVAVVADLRLEGSSGPQFLDVVMRDFPGAQRFVLVDLTDKQTILKCVGTSHHFLAKPCDAAKLLDALERAAQLDVWFASDTVKRLVTQMQKLPSPPSIYFQIVRELRSSTSSLDNIGDIIAQDLAVTAKLLQLVNSAAFALRRKVSNSADAVMFIGLETTKSLILLAHTYSHFDRISDTHFSIEALWRHSLAVGRLSREIARAEELSDEMAEECFTAGLLHDIGKLLLAANQPEAFNWSNLQAQERRCELWETEQETFGTTHAELGAWLAALWGLPLPIVEALALHHFPTRFLSKTVSPLTIVHAANVLLQETPRESGPCAPQLDMSYLDELGLSGRVEEWRLLAQQHQISDSRHSQEVA